MAGLTIEFLVWLLCIGIATLAVVYIIQFMESSVKKEGFDSGIPIRITACPAATSTYVTGGGDTNCCDGDIVDGECNGNLVCSLSPKPGKNLLSCAEWIMREWRKRSDKFCAPSMPYYFGTMNRKASSVEGCSASKCSSDGTTPQDPARPACKIYRTSVEEYGKTDSCFNVKAGDQMATPIPSATKQIVSTGGSQPALLSATYIPPNGSSVVPVSCYDWDRVAVYFNSHDPSGRLTAEWAKNYKDKYVIFCGASKAYYVDRTLTKANAIGV